VLVGHLVEVKLEGGDDLFLKTIGGEVTAAIRDAERGETEASGGDAGDEVRVELAAGVLAVGAIEDLAAGGINLLGEEEAGGVLHLFEEDEVVVAEQPGVRGLSCRGLLGLGEWGGKDSGKESSAQQLRRTASRDVRRSRGADTHSLSIVRFGCCRGSDTSVRRRLMRCVRVEPDEDEALGRNGDGEDAVAELEALRRRRFSGSAELYDLISGWEGRSAHSIVCFDDVSMIGV
jgi:hypothetical protein